MKRAQLRRRAHEHFDLLWRSGIMSRTNAYRWLQCVMQVSSEKGHIGKFTKAQCVLLIQWVDTYLKENGYTYDELKIMSAQEAFEEFIK